LLNKIDYQQLLSEDSVTDAVAEIVEDKDRWEDIAFDSEDEKTKGKDKLVGEAKDKAVRLVRVHHRQVAPTIDPLPRSEKLPNGGVSRKFSISLDGWLRERARLLYEQSESVADRNAKKHLESVARSLNSAARDGYDFCGEIDIQSTVNNKVWIRDSKTAAKSPSKSKETGRYSVVDESEQLSAYALAVKVLDGELPAGVGLDFLVDTAEPKSVICESTRTLADAEMFLNRVISAIHSIKAGVFVPSSSSWWGCSKKWCGFWATCPYKSIPKDFS
jgi:hypothetical protein